jgi:hypothetical protein
LSLVPTTWAGWEARKGEEKGQRTVGERMREGRDGGRRRVGEGGGEVGGEEGEEVKGVRQGG